MGLNLTYRSLASVLKYDKQIPETDEERKRRKLKRPVKGYYNVEKDLVGKIKNAVAPGYKGPFKTLECSIMDLADDIAYSTYDLEDAFKAEFLSPLEMIAATGADKNAILQEVNAKIVEEYKDGGSANLLTPDEIDLVLKNVFNDLFEGTPTDIYQASSGVYRKSCVLAEDGYFRTDFTSKLVNLFMQGVKLFPNTDFPAMSTVKFNLETFKMVEILKKYAFNSLIMSPRLKMAESRGREIIKVIFNTLMRTEDGRRLLPEDWRKVYFGKDSTDWRRRTVCDFIASMTDRYCVEFYSRLIGIDAPSIHKPY